MRKLAAIILLFLFAKSSLAQRMHPQNKQDIIAVCDKFVSAFKDGKYSDACEYLKQYSVIPETTLDTLATTFNDQINSASDYLGKYLSFELISERVVKNTLSKLVYLVKFERMFLKIRFILYNNGSGWTVTNFTYNNDAIDLFDEAVK